MNLVRISLIVLTLLAAAACATAYFAARESKTTREQNAAILVRVDKLAERVERLTETMEQMLQLQKEGSMPAIPWTSGGMPHVFPAMSPNVGETNDHFRARYIAALDADMKAHPPDHP